MLRGQPSVDSKFCRKTPSPKPGMQKTTLQQRTPAPSTKPPSSPETWNAKQNTKNRPRSGRALRVRVFDPVHSSGLVHHGSGELRQVPPRLHGLLAADHRRQHASRQRLRTAPATGGGEWAGTKWSCPKHQTGPQKGHLGPKPCNGGLFQPQWLRILVVVIRNKRTNGFGSLGLCQNSLFAGDIGYRDRDLDLLCCMLLVKRKVSRHDSRMSPPCNRLVPTILSILLCTDLLLFHPTPHHTPPPHTPYPGA